jgi:RNA polymerase sigma-70 factor (ECF subfamily)
MTNAEEFEAFMRSYQDMVFTTAVRLLGNDADAADAAQEVFLKAFERFGELRGNERAGGWLKVTTRNHCLNHLTRYRARYKLFTDVEGDDDHAPDYAAQVAAPETHQSDLEAADRRQVLAAALHKLPDGQRVPLVLYHFEELSYEEIAARLEVSLSKVKTDIHRARVALRRKLAKGQALPTDLP